MNVSMKMTALLLLAGLTALPTLSRAESPEKDDESLKRERLEFFVKQRLPPGGTELPMQRYLEARERMGAMAAYPIQGGPAPAAAAPAGSGYALGCGWEEIGPGNVGGRTKSMLIDPRNPLVLYAGGVSGGIFKTVDGGLNWNAVGDLLPNLGVCSLAMDPTDSNVLYAGTGETIAIPGLRGLGIFKSLDAGLTWTQLPSTNNPSFYYVGSLLISPLDHRRLYAGTETGIWRSSDAGASWTQIFSADPSIMRMSIRSDKSSDVILAACGSWDSNGSIYLNSAADGAGTFSKVYSQPNTGFVSVAIAPSNQDVMYGLLENQSLSCLLSVVRSTDGGATWSVRHAYDGFSAKTISDFIMTGIRYKYCQGEGEYSQGWWGTVLSVDPLDPNRVWSGNVELMRSDDGGQSWGAVNPAIHTDQHVILFEPGYDAVSKKAVYVGNDAGVYRFSDGRGPTLTSNFCSGGGIPYVSLNRHYRASQFYHGLPLPGGAAYLGGLQDNGNQAGTDAAGVDGWRMIQDGDGGFVAYDKNNPDTVYVENTHLNFYKGSISGGPPSFVRSQSGIGDFGGLFIQPFAMDPLIPNRLWMPMRRIWRTNDGAASWQQAGATISGNGSAVAVHPLDSDKVLIGTDTGLIYRTSAAGAAGAATAWPSATAQSGAYVSGLAFDPGSPGVAYASFSSFGVMHVMKTTDGGVSWLKADGSGASGIPDVPADCVMVDPAASNRVFAGTDLGLFVSTDSGSSWSVAAGFPAAPVHSLSVEGGKLYAFTFGRSVWRSCMRAMSPTPSSTPSFSASGTATGTQSPSATAIPSVSPSSSPTPGSSASATPGASASSTPGVAASASPSPSAAMSPSATLSATPSPSPSLTASPSPRSSPSASPTSSPALPSLTRSATASLSYSPTPSRSPSLSPTRTAMAALTATQTRNPSPTPAATAVATATAGEAPSGLLSKVSVVPNPASGGMALLYSLSRDADEVQARLYSPAFALAARYAALPAKPGRGIRAWLDLKDAEGTPLALGIYYLVVEAKSGEAKDRVLLKIYVKR